MKDSNYPTSIFHKQSASTFFEPFSIDAQPEIPSNWSFQSIFGIRGTRNDWKTFKEAQKWKSTTLNRRNHVNRDCRLVCSYSSRVNSPFWAITTHTGRREEFSTQKSGFVLFFNESSFKSLNWTIAPLFSALHLNDNGRSIQTQIPHKSVIPGTKLVMHRLIALTQILRIGLPRKFVVFRSIVSCFALIIHRTERNQSIQFTICVMLQ